MRARWLVAASLWIVLAGCDRAREAVSGPPSGAPRRPDVLLVVIDTLRVDHVGAYGYPRPTTPELDRIAAEGVTFLNARSSSSWTRPAVGSIFTSLFPSEHGAVSTGSPLRSDVATLPALLQAAGYVTVGVSANFVHVSEASGFARGFDVFTTVQSDVPSAGEEHVWATQKPDGNVRYVRDGTGEEVNRAVRERLPPPGDAPLFLYVQYMDPHAGYTPPPDLRQKFVRDPAFDRASPPATAAVLNAFVAQGTLPGPLALGRFIDLYDAEIAAADRALGELVRELEARGRPLVMAVVADHGEAFGEHHALTHGVNLFDELLRVPLIVRDGRAPRAGDKRTEPVDVLDVPTTLLAAAGVPAPSALRGRDLLAPAAGLRPRDSIAELAPDPLAAWFLQQVRKHRYAVSRLPWKLIVSRDDREVLFDLARDPREAAPLDPKTEPVAAELGASGRAIAGRPSEPPQPAAPALDEQTRAGLKALGYVE